MEYQSRKPTPLEEEELDGLLLSGLGILPIEDQSQPHFIFIAIHLLLEEIRKATVLPKGLSIDDFCAQLGVVYGEQLCLTFGWDWIYLTITDRYEGIAVANPERNVVFFPIPNLFQWTKKSEQNRCMDLFTEIKNRKYGTDFQILH